MRGWPVVLAACATAAPPPAAPHPGRPWLAILGLDPVPGDGGAAVELTVALRAAADAPASRFELTGRRDQLADLLALASCPPGDPPACLAEIGAYLNVDYMIYGHLVRRGEGWALALDLMDVARRFNRRAVVQPVTTDRAATARAAYAKLGAATGTW